MKDSIRNAQGQTEEEFLAAYDPNRYEHPSCTCDACLMTVRDGRLQILLIQRGNFPWLGDWAMPGGFVNMDEDLDEAVQRELYEETGLKRPAYFTQLYTFGKVDRDPRTRVITTSYLILCPPQQTAKMKAGDDAADADWFDIRKETVKRTEKERIAQLVMRCAKRDLTIAYEIRDRAKDNYIVTTSRLLKRSNARLAGDHYKTINKAMDVLQHRAVRTGILFNLLPREVTLRQIQDAYEALLGHPVDTGNFRRDIKKMLVPTGHTRLVRGRQSALYSFNPLVAYLEENL